MREGQHGKGGETINILNTYRDIQNDSVNGLMLVKAVLDQPCLNEEYKEYELSLF